LGLFQAPPPGTPLYEALVRAGAIAASDGPEPYYADVAAIAYLGGFALAMGIDLLLNDSYADVVEQSDFNFIVSEIQLYKPSYTYDTPTIWAPNWEDYFGLLDELYETQLGYVETIRDSVCSPEYAPHSEELLAQAQRGIHFRGSIDAIIYQNDDLIDQQLELAYEDYRAEGGDLTLEDWISQGMPEVDSPVRILFTNQLPERLPDELAEARRVGAEPIRFGDDAFETAVNQGTVKFVVTEDGELLITPHTVNGVEISHAVLSEGRPVMAAGQADIAGSNGEFIGINITPHSGHYLNGATFEESAQSLQVAKEAFERINILFPE
jgi:hypothetical protein